MSKDRKNDPRFGSSYDPKHKPYYTFPRFPTLDAELAAVRALQEEAAAMSSFSTLGEDLFRTAFATELQSRIRADPAYTKAREQVKDWLETAPDQAFDDIAGNEDALAQIKDAVRAPGEHGEIYQAYGLTMPKGVLLHGPPGCGKTMFARAAASEMRRLYGDKVEFINLAGNDLQSFYAGQTEQRIKAIFAFARAYKAMHGHPLLIFIDEADALLPNRKNAYRYEQGNVATFLAEMDGVNDSGAFVMLATNRPDMIDEAVLRDGRCDFKIKIERPDEAALRAIVLRNFAKIPVADDVADLVNAAVESLLDPFRVLVDATAIRANLKDGTVERFNRHFLLEHIVSGAMAASIPSRAARIAFARDKATGKVSGVSVSDVIAAVTDVYEQNRGLDHGFAFREFVEEAMRELKDQG